MSTVRHVRTGDVASADLATSAEHHTITADIPVADGHTSGTLDDGTPVWVVVGPSPDAVAALLVGVRAQLALGRNATKAHLDAAGMTAALERWAGE